MESLQDKAAAAIGRLERYQKQLYDSWNGGNVSQIKANLKLIKKAADEVEAVIKQQLYDNA